MRLYQSGFEVDLTEENIVAVAPISAVEKPGPSAEKGEKQTIRQIQTRKGKEPAEYIPEEQQEEEEDKE
jgi:hypothetical protein